MTERAFERVRGNAVDTPTQAAARQAREEAAVRKAQEQQRGGVMANRSGWVAGDIVACDDDPGRGKWLTVWGSYYTRPQMHETADAARSDKRRGESVAHVTEVPYPGVGLAYLITAGTLTARRPGPPCGLDECDCHLYA